MAKPAVGNVAIKRRIDLTTCVQPLLIRELSKVRIGRGVAIGHPGRRPSLRLPWYRLHS
jgi:hypothetical protein